MNAPTLRRSARRYVVPTDLAARLRVLAGRWGRSVDDTFTVAVTLAGPELLAELVRAALARPGRHRVVRVAVDPDTYGRWCGWAADAGTTPAGWLAGRLTVCGPGLLADVYRAELVRALVLTRAAENQEGGM